MKLNVLIICGRYLPGYRDGGPVRSIKNLTDALGEEINFKILTTDRDHGDSNAYPNIIVNGWNRVGEAEVYYVKPGAFHLKLLKRLCNEADIVYLCGCFNDYAVKTLLLKRIGMIKPQVIIAAMGLFSPNAFRLKYWKKKCFVLMSFFVGLFKSVYWSATSITEINDIRKQIKAPQSRFFVAKDIPRHVVSTLPDKHKNSSVLKVVWISRISPNKNLLGCIKILEQVKSNVVFTILGPKQDMEYWKTCEEEIAKLPSNVSWTYLGEVESERVVLELQKYDVFLFPSFGENYGHVIQEALSAGLPCLLSENTPWRFTTDDFAGATIPIDQPLEYARWIDSLATMSDEKYQKYVRGSHLFALKASQVDQSAQQYKSMFEQLS